MSDAERAALRLVTFDPDALEPVADIHVCTGYCPSSEPFRAELFWAKVARTDTVSHRTNTLRGNTVTAANAAKTHCHAGHPLSGENLYVRPNDGARTCRECKREINRRAYRKRLAGAAR